tara:strand:+ start:1352 stop:1654 length:303 start_codon:yes stop_codon:yes gene_type:complete
MPIPQSWRDRWEAARIRVYKQYMSDDVAAALAKRVPLSSSRGKRLIRTMRARVRDIQQASPGLSHQDVVDDATSDVITTALATDSDRQDWELYDLMMGRA